MAQLVLGTALGIALGAGFAHRKKALREGVTPSVEKAVLGAELVDVEVDTVEGEADVTISLVKQSLNAEKALKAHQLPLDRESVIKTFISLVPKAELHVHIEGTLEPRQMLDLARRNGLAAPYASEDEARRAYHFKDLQEFLDLYYNGCSVLRTTEDFYDLAMAYLLRAATMHTMHVEFFFDPQTHTANGIPFDVFMPGLTKAAKDARAMGVSVQLIMCFLRHLSEDSALETLEQAKPWLDQIVAVGLDSSEMGNPPAKFERVMAQVRQLGLPTVAHAGEEGPAQYVWDALNILKVSRVDHGVHSLDDPQLMTHLKEHNVPLTVCPLSNLKLKVWDGELVGKLKELIVGTGLTITVNSDDPAYFDGYINENYEWLSSELKLNVSQIADLAANSFKASFISVEAKANYVKKVRELETAWVNIEKQVLALT